ncbi:MAG: rhodanese-like domain-containing protein [Bacteroidota bacterium]|nr:rhodanese-like domain-containing protein [Bacteroidota bacterium]
MRILLSAALFAIVTICNAQYKNDNVAFKTVYLEDLCKTIQNNSDFLILDVRSEGEYDDTSSSSNLNIGHLKNAKHIDVRELPNRLNELAGYREKPVFVYCSHSQRSRRASKMLSDSGFLKVFNINAGLTGFHLFQNDLSDCSEVIMETNTPYTLLSPQQVSENISMKKSYFILDIRNDSVFNGSSTDERKKAMGRLSGAINIPFTKLESSLSAIPTNQPVLIVDDFGNESPKAALLLLGKGYKDANVLFNGMDAMAQYQADPKNKSSIKWIPGSNYHLLPGEEFDKLMRSGKPVVALDVRTRDEFNNQSKNSWQNIGNIKDAINIPYVDLQQQASSLAFSKNTPVVIYAFSNSSEAYESARILSSNGYKNVNVLLGGLFNLRWKAANLKGREHLKEWAVNIPVENQ